MEHTFRLKEEVFYADEFRTSISEITKIEDVSFSEHKHVFNHEYFSHTEEAFSRTVNLLTELLEERRLLGHFDNILFILLKGIQRMHHRLTNDTDYDKTVYKIKAWRKHFKNLEEIKQDQSTQIIIKTSGSKPVCVSNPILVKQVIDLLSEREIVMQDFFNHYNKESDLNVDTRIVWNEMVPITSRKRYTAECVKICYDLKEYIHVFVPELKPKNKKQFSKAEKTFYYNIVTSILHVDLNKEFEYNDYTPEKLITSFLTDRQNYLRRKAKKEMKR